MDIVLLSASVNLYSTKRLAEESEKRRHAIEQISHTVHAMNLRDNIPKIYFWEEDITH
ncbi:MAG: ribosomal protein S6--L-glutamate ligase [Maribacter sp.]|jgi:ribosomal protein S6--L-glutamate ligase